MWMPSASAAWMIVVPAATSVSRPSMLHLGMQGPQAPLAVQLAGDDVQAPDRGHGVRDQATLDDLGVRLIDVEARRANLDPPGELAAVADDVEAQLAVRRLGVAIDLSGR